MPVSEGVARALLRRASRESPLRQAGGEVVAARARSLVGVRFRLHGRDPAMGLDCVGVVALATGLNAPTGYALRGGSADGWSALLDNAGLERVRTARAGDVVLAEAGAGQFHLVMTTRSGFVHADAGLRRVVERPGAVPWPIVGRWRINEGRGGWRRSS